MKYRDDIKKIKPLLIAITYFVFLIFMVVNFNTIAGWISKFLRLLTPFFYGVGIAFVLNIPMRRCEEFIVKHTKPTNLIYKKKRGIAIIFAIIVMFAVIGLFMSIIIPQLFITIVNSRSSRGISAQSISSATKSDTRLLPFATNTNGSKI